MATVADLTARAREKSGDHRISVIEGKTGDVGYSFDDLTIRLDPSLICSEEDRGNRAVDLFSEIHRGNLDLLTSAEEAPAAGNAWAKAFGQK